MSNNSEWVDVKEDEWIDIEPGEIMTPETMRRRQLQRNLQSGRLEENIGQFAGGLLGGSVGGLPGSMIGGALGRPLGRVMSYQRQALQNNPIQSIYNVAKEPLFAPIRIALQLPPTQKEALGKTTGMGIASEAIGAPLGLVGGKIASKVGGSVIKTLIPKTVAERGLKEGFKKLLNPAYYKERLPQNFVNRVENMFNLAKNRYGVFIENALKHPKYKLININQVKSNLQESLSKIGINGLKDINKIETITTRDKNLIINQMKSIFKLKNTQSPYALWLKRRELDNLIYGKRWHEDALDILNKMRFSLNDPIRQAGPAIAKNFDEYNFIMQAKEALARKTEKAIERRTTGEIYSQSIEDFTKSLMQPDKSETRRLLLDIDPKLANIMFDVSSAKILGKQVPPITPYRAVAEKLIDPKMIANIAGQFQRPTMLRLKQGVGRLAPTTFADILTQGE